jgi:hypothetical protein
MPIHCRLLLLAIWGGFGLAYFRGLLMLLSGFLLGVAMSILTLLAVLRWILLVLILNVHALRLSVLELGSVILRRILLALILSTVAA